MSLLEKPQDDSYLVLFIGQRTILRIPAIFSMERRRRRGLWWKGRRSSWLINRRKGRWNARASERTSRTEWSDESAKGLSLQPGAVSCRRGFVLCFLRVPQAVRLYCSCHAAQASTGNLQKKNYKTFSTSHHPRQLTLNRSDEYCVCKLIASINTEQIGSIHT